MSKLFQYVRRGGVYFKSGAGTGRAHLDFSARTRAAPSSSRGEKARAHRPCPGASTGSALLIVLGFLSFMMISAVSFAIYMRIERQASSNYRHSVTARHLLNAGLCRAIDEIDGELRVPSAPGGGAARPVKFPDWPGRVKPSAVPNGGQNNQDARVLSLEALSFIPAIFVNDVRRYAIPNTEDTKDPNGNTWAGAKWRPLSMPVNFNSGENAYGGAEVGRYAYVCVNLSDMLDVNSVGASAASTNRISISHLFDSAARAKTFDDNKKNVDRRYESLQDFYACLYARKDATFGSPYHELMETGDDVGFDEAVKHVLVTDSIAKPEYVRSADPCNVIEDPPVSSALLGAARTTSASLETKFQTALGNALVGGLQNQGSMMATMIADYLDKDSLPKQLNMPSVEMVPMISQILVPDFFAPTIIKQTLPSVADPSKTKDVYSVQLISAPAVAYVDVELVWPFKNQEDRTPQPAFDLEVNAFLKLDYVHAPHTSGDFNQPPVSVPGAYVYVPLTAQANIPSFWSKNTAAPAACYEHVPVKFSVNAAAITFPIIDSEKGVPEAGFQIDKPFSVSLVVFARVKQGSDYVDSVPQMMPYPNSNINQEYILTRNKIFFQTVASPPVAATMSAPFPIQYEWKSLEVPDARFNWKASNWIKNPELNAITPAVNPSTQALLGEDGRDGDIYLSVSDIGEMQSPGELGFIVRPFNYQILGNPVDFRTQNAVANSEDQAHMFRTIRLYDHGDAHPRDKIYDHFIVRAKDGTLQGTRVNPLSDLPQVLAAAVQHTPVDYYWAGEKTIKGQVSATRNHVFDETLSVSAWAGFTNGWFRCLQSAKTASPFNIAWNSNLSDVYGRADLFGWYSEGDATTVFAQSLSDPLHEIDRKMLFDYTLNNFSDRQQLFLYILRAEVTVPSFGGSDMGGLKPVAGGRAVALVWRDPYPREYNKANNTWRKGNWYTDIRRVSPWYQHNNNQYDTSRDESSMGSDGDDDSVPARYDGYHDHRILFFKQLDN